MSMIQPATLPAAAKLLLAIDGQTINGEAAGLDAQFSALLAANFITLADTAPDKPDASPAPDMSFKPQLRPAGSKADGKAGGKLPGKLLPDSPALAAFAAMLKDLRGTAATRNDTPAAKPDETVSTNSPPANQPADQAAAPVVTAEPVLTPAAPTSEIVRTMPLPVAEPVSAPALAASQIRPADADFQQRIPPVPAQPASDQPLTDSSPAMPEQAAQAPVGRASFNPASLQGLAFMEQASPAPVDPANANPATPDSPAQELPQSRPESQPLVIQSGLTTRVVLVPRSQPHVAELAKLQTMAIEQGKTGEAGLQIAKVQVHQTPEDHAARTVTALAPASAETSTVSPEPIRMRPVANNDDEVLPETPRAALAQLDATPLFSADSSAAIDAIPAGATGPAPAATPSRTPDFAALIDRLVEARAAAQATLEPHTVNAAIQHADFGEVSLQFRHDTAGLSVVMASADPDLAKALQVAAPTGGSFAGQSGNSGDANPPQWRQDTSGQQSAGQSASGQTSAFTSQAQSQTPQHRGQAPQRAPDQTFGAANPSPRSRSEASQAQRSGIFA